MAAIYLLESSQYDCLNKVESMRRCWSCGERCVCTCPWFDAVVGFVWTGAFWAVTHIDADSHAARFAMRHARVDPCRTPQWKFACTSPYGVVTLIVRLWRDSAIHSMYPVGGKPRR